MSVKRTRVEDIRTGDTVRLGDENRHIVGTRHIRGSDIELFTTVGTLTVPRSTFLFVSRGSSEATPEAAATSQPAPAPSPVSAPLFRAAGS